MLLMDDIPGTFKAVLIQTMFFCSNLFCQIVKKGNIVFAFIVGGLEQPVKDFAELGKPQIDKIGFNA